MGEKCLGCGVLAEEPWSAAGAFEREWKGKNLDSSTVPIARILERDLGLEQSTKEKAWEGSQFKFGGQVFRRDLDPERVYQHRPGALTEAITVLRVCFGDSSSEKVDSLAKSITKGN